MAEKLTGPKKSLGILEKSYKDRVTRIEIAAVVVSAIWLALCSVFFLSLGPADRSDGSTISLMLVMLTIFLPVAMIWVAATAARASKVMREESQRLQVAVDAMRHAYVAESQSRHAVAEPSVAKKLEEIASVLRCAEAISSSFLATEGSATA
ncbi:MAG: hypothetical protein AAGD04_17940 [Pseudomonadota bacterium]